MTGRPDTSGTRRVTVRLPNALGEQVELVRIRQRLATFSDGLFHVVERGLEAIANERAKPERLEAMLARMDDLVVTLVAIQNIVHELDPAEVADTKRAIVEQLRERRAGGTTP